MRGARGATWRPFERRRRSERVFVLLSAPVVVVLLAVASEACRRPGETGFLLSELVASPEPPAGQGTLVFPRPPRRVEIEIDQERRPAVLTPPGGFAWRGRVPPGARLVAGFGIVPAAWRPGTMVEVVVEADAGRGREIVEVARSGGGEAQGWGGLTADLGHYAGRETTLSFRARISGPGGLPLTGPVAWAPVALVGGAHPPDERPNIVLLLVDTLRRDRLTPYGYPRATSPEIQRRLADRGTVVEEAYAQAPWTLPSLVSLMSGRYPGEVVTDDPAGYSLPHGIPALAERLRALGYRTAGFYANPTLHAGNGFARGFDTFYTAPPTLDSMNLHADDVTGRALPWVDGHRGRPFFLYVHYIDPHDPYENPDMPGGRSPFLPGYDGPVAGTWIHGFYTGRLQLPDPARDLPHVNALYDGEVRYVDRFIGSLLEALEPDLRDTLVALTADHGEEILDHGGWKHGQSLYEEQIHVPLIVRWDGRIAAGARLSGTVRLLDLLPTLVAAAGGRVEPECDGVDLVPALTGRGPVPRRPAFAQHLSSGPLRTMAVLGREKLILFNREEPFAPADELQAHFWGLDLGRFARHELYDLRHDPGERASLTTARPERAVALAPVVHRQLDRQLPGLRVWVPPAGPGLPAGARLGGSIRFEHPPARWVPYFTAPEDRVVAAGDTLRFDLAVERLGKGFLVHGTPGTVLALELRLDGRPLPAGRVRLGPGRRWAGGPVAPAALLAPAWPGAFAPGEAALALWRPAVKPPARGGSDPETERRLKALGYIQ